jgi:hypothetical protein
MQSDLNILFLLNVVLSEVLKLSVVEFSLKGGHFFCKLIVLMDVIGAISEQSMGKMEVRNFNFSPMFPFLCEFDDLHNKFLLVVFDGATKR